MRKFTKIVAPALIAAMGIGAAASVPAEAAPWTHNAGRPTPARDANIRADINGLNRDIDRAAARRTISPREANGVRRQAVQVQRLYASYARNGLTPSEVRTLQNRVDQIRAALHMERRDWNNHRR
jgi:hypothetical protein